MDKRHCYRFLMADWLAKAVCFICYVVYPTTNTRPEIVGSDIWAQLMRFLYSMDAADNLFPSIHCLVSWLCYIGIRGNKSTAVDTYNFLYLRYSSIHIHIDYEAACDI